MAKINHEEYEILKALDEKWKWIARDSGSVLSDTLWIYEYVPERAQSYWMEGWGEYKELPYHLFRFVQWVNSEPYRIAELIEEYENEESEAKILESDYDKVIDELTRYVDQLEDEPEVLSQEDNINIVLDDLKEHIKEQQSLSQNVGMAHTPAGNDTHYRQYDYVLECINEYEPSDDLQNLLVPKQELPAIPKFVAEWIEVSRKATYHLLGAVYYGAYNEDMKEWLFKGDKRTRQDNQDKLTKAWLAYPNIEVEEEQKYVVRLDDESYLQRYEIDNKNIVTPFRVVGHLKEVAIKFDNRKKAEMVAELVEGKAEEMEE